MDAGSSRPYGEPASAEGQGQSPSQPAAVVSARARASSESRTLPRYTVGYVFDAAMMAHSCVGGHPEMPERVLRIYRLLQENGCIDRMQNLPIRHVRKAEAMLVHSEDHWDKVLAISHMTYQDIEDSKAFYEALSLYVNAQTPYCARLSCGGVISASLAVARGELEKSFAIVRPPGHHAEPDEHMGFCFFNNVAVAAKVVQRMTPIRKILILDWDVHHGNGTQKAFSDDPSVLYISIHRYDNGQFYPSSTYGAVNSCGEGEGKGFSVNVPWPEGGMQDADYLYAFQQIVMPIAMEFAPELVIISAGFDAADGDDLGECHVTPTGYAHMTHMLASLAGGKLVVALEGGYNLESISASSLAVAKVLLGEPPAKLDPMVASDVGTETVYQVALEQSKYWKSINPKATEPKEDYGELVLSISEILKRHREWHLVDKFDMYVVPLLPELQERFAAQVMCTSDALDNDTLVVLVHEFGELRAELAGVMTCDLNMERSYLIDISEKLMEWVKAEGYALLDVNLLEKPFKHRSQRVETDSLVRNLLTYVWDNYIQLSRSTRVILIGHGPGCAAVMETVRQRAFGIMKKVEVVVQIVGDLEPSVVRKDTPDLLAWYKQRSQVFVSSNHSIRSNPKAMDRHGGVIYIDDLRTIRLVLHSLPIIKEYVKYRLNQRQEAVKDVTGKIGSVTLS